MELEEGGEHLAWGRKTPFHLPGSRGEGMVPCARVPVRKSWEFKEADKLASFKVSWGEGGVVSKQSRDLQGPLLTEGPVEGRKLECASIIY